MGKSAEKKYYGVINGKQGSGIFYGTWEQVKPLVIGIKGAKQTPSHKEFTQAAKDYEEQTKERIKGHYNFNENIQAFEFSVLVNTSSHPQISMSDLQPSAIKNNEKQIEDDWIEKFEALSLQNIPTGYLAENESSVTLKEVKSKKYKKRLLLGEADFSFARALVKKHEEKHPELPKSITATEYRSSEDIQQAYPQTFKENYNYLAKKGVTLLFGVDATALQNNEALNTNRYPRIHFNFPHDGSSFKKQTLPKLIGNFFKSVAHLQKEGDRVHMAMPKGKKSGQGSEEFYQGYYYDIYNASVQAGYAFLKKRHFIKNEEQRYKGYQHRETNQSKEAEVTANSREFIFEKTNMLPKVIETQVSPPRKSRAKIYNEERNCLPDTLTSSESSDYIEEELTSASSKALII